MASVAARACRHAEAEAMLDGLDARVAAWTDADPLNDPPFFLSGRRTCTGCHQ